MNTAERHGVIITHLIKAALVCSLLTAPAPGLCARDTTADLARVRDHMRQYLLRPTPRTTAEALTPATGRRVRGWTASLRSDGSWGDIHYDDQTPGFWQAVDHLNRTRAMAEAYAGQGRPGRRDPATRRAILLALDYWLRKDYRNPNWWQNEIGVPSAMADILILMQKDLSPGELDRGTKILARAAIRDTGQNRVWEAGITLLRAALRNDPVMARLARNAIVGELGVTTREGLQPDGSFHQHGPDLQTGNYGLAYAGSLSQWAQVLRGTSFAIDHHRLSVLRDYLLQGVTPFLWKGALDISACNRQLFPQSPAAKAEAFGIILAGMARADGPHAAQYREAAVRSRATWGGAVPPINKHFWRSDIMVHRRPGYSLSVKMASRREIGAESINRENLSGYYLADGATYIYRTGHEYEDIFPVWDWRRLPGVTCPQAAGPLPRFGAKDYRPRSSFVGGVSDGAYGAAALNLNRDGLVGRKSWFFFDRETVCLGAGLRTGRGRDIATSVNQCLLHGGATVRDGGTVMAVAPGRRVYPRLRWAYQDGIGYVFPQATPVTVSAQPQSGSWQSVYGAGAKERVTREVFSLWIDHGAGPQDARYGYILYPTASLGRMTALAGGRAVAVLSNTADLQAVRDKALRITMAAFYSPGQLEYTANRRVAVGAPCLLMLRETKRGQEVAVSDPTQELPSVQVTLDGRTKRVPLPTGPNAGRSVILHVSGGRR